MPKGVKHLWKQFNRPSLESQIVVDSPSTDLIIDSPEGQKTEEKQEFRKDLKQKTKPKKPTKKTKTKKKKTATDVHLEIKKLVEESSFDSHRTARSILLKAFDDGFSGKRLARWETYLDGYFEQHEEDLRYVQDNILESIKIPEEFMGSSTRTAYTKPQETTEENKEEFTEETVEARITETKKEKSFMVDIPDLPLDELEDAAAEPIEDKSIEDESGGAVVYGILGAGQAGGRLAESFYNLGYKKVLAVNTAESDLDGLAKLPEGQKVVMKTDTGGGAGKDMNIALAATEQHQQEIYEKMQTLFGKVDRVLVCAGGGGGTGGGSCLRLIETAKKYLQYIGVNDVNKKVGVLLTLPTSGEANSPTVAENAHRIGTKLCELADSGQVSPLIIFDNDKIKKMYPRLTVRQFWPTVNSTVTGLFHMFNVLAAQPSDLTSFDPADYGRVLSAGGCMIMGMTTLKEYQTGTDVSKAIRSNLEKGLLCGGFDISSAKAAACIATAPATVLDNTPGLMDSFETGFDTLANITGNATVMRGIYEVSKDKVVVYTMLTGLARPQKRLDELKKSQQNKVEKVEL